MPDTEHTRRRPNSWLARTALFLLLMAGVSAHAHARQQTIFVNHAATGSNDGSSWQHAFNALQDAIAASSAGDAIWIAEGTYRPDEGQNVAPGDRAATFLISHDLSLIGGFAGNETSVEAADPDAHPTILSGDLLGNDGEVFDPTSPLREDNAVHVVVLARTSPMAFSVTMDGLAVEGGQATISQTGAAQYSEDIIDIFGAGIFVTQPANMVFHNGTIRRNYAAICGGGVYATGLLTVSRSVIKENGASVPMSGVGCPEVGAGILVRGPESDSSVRVSIRTTEFGQNTGGGRCGGAVALFQVSSRIYDSYFVNNKSGSGAAICAIGKQTLSLSHVAIRNNEGFTGLAKAAAGNALFLDNKIIANLSGSLIVENGNRMIRAFGGAIWIERQSRLHITNTTLSDNVADAGEGILIDNTSSVIFQNSILHDDSVVLGNAQGPSDGLLTFFSEYSILNGELPEFTTLGAGIQQGVDPLFDENYHLLPGSPAVDAGANVIVPADTFDVDMDGDTEEQISLDLAGNPRFVMQEGSAPNRTVDLGPFEMPFTSTSIDSVVPKERDETCALTAIYPNPAATDVTAELSAPGRLDLLDLQGRRVATWSRLPAGDVQLSFSAPGGAYFLRYESSRDGTACSLPFTIMN